MPSIQPESGRPTRSRDDAGGCDAEGLSSDVRYHQPANRRSPPCNDTAWRRRPARASAARDNAESVRSCSSKRFAGATAPLLGLGWAAALRPGELVALDADDLSFDGPPYDPEATMTVYLHHSKTDQDGRGDFVIVPYSSDQATCPASLALHAIEPARTRTAGST